MTSSPSSSSSSLPMPVWINNDTTIDSDWISTKTGICNIQNCTVQDISNTSRRAPDGLVKNGSTLLLTLEISDKNNDVTSTNTKQYLVIKQTPITNEQQLQLSRNLGLVREAYFYNDLAPYIQISSQADSDEMEATTTRPSDTPKVYYAYGDSITGAKCVIMEYFNPVDWIDSGIFFGKGNPNNWDRNLNQLISRAYPPEKAIGRPTTKDIAAVTFRSIARVHAYYWKNTTLLQTKYQLLRGYDWSQSQSYETWLSSQQLIQNYWNTYIDEAIDSSGKQQIVWNPIVREAVEKAVANISWDDQIARLNVNDTNSHWTLVHGDFWPGNVIWNIPSTTSTNPTIKLLDWEMVGIGSGPQDLGQYVISNFDPFERRACEQYLLHEYYNELQKSDNRNLKDVTFDYCWKEYTIGGVERWIWFVIYFLGQNSTMQPWTQFFHNQIAEFMMDHTISPNNDIGQPRP